MFVVGLQDSSFTAKDGSGKMIHGYRFHVQAPISEGGVGFRCDSFWCSKDDGRTLRTYSKWRHQPGCLRFFKEGCKKLLCVVGVS